MLITTYQSSIAKDNDNFDTINVNNYLLDATHQLLALIDEDLLNSTNAKFANNNNTRMSEVMNKLTLNNESIKFKRKLFKNFQFLIKKKSRLHV